MATNSGSQRPRGAGTRAETSGRGRRGPARSRPPVRRGERLHGDIEVEPKGAFEAVYAFVRRVPLGSVVTYGQVSAALEGRLSPAAVGWAMSACPEDVPWQRVVNARGGISTDRRPDLPPGLQRAILEQEGIAFRDDDTIDLAHYRWEGD